jgi:membrane protein
MNALKTLWQVLVEIFREAMHDRITAEAARAAYYLFLSLFPLILALFALTGILGGETTFEWIMERLAMALPGDAATYLTQAVKEVTGESRPGILSFSILFTCWSASNIFAILADGLNRMYDIEEGRPWWKRRLISLAALVLGSVLLIGGSVALLAGPELLAFLGLGPTLELLRLPLAIVMLVLLMWLVYFLLPARDMRDAARPTLIGALVGTGLWLAATLGFRVYVSQFGRYDQTYGVVGGIIILLLWLYLTALAILFGGEVAATIQQQRDDDWEVGKAPRKRSE